MTTSIKDQISRMKQKLDMFYDSDLAQLQHQWTKIGFTDADKEQGLDQLNSQICELISFYLSTENDNCEAIENQVINGRQILQEKCKELSIKMPGNSEDSIKEESKLSPRYENEHLLDATEVKGLSENLPSLENDNITILEKSRILDNLIEILNEMKKQRIADNNECINQEKNMISKLRMNDRVEMHFTGRNSDEAYKTIIPSQHKIDNFRLHNNSLAESIDLRQQSIRRKQSNYVDIISKLNEMPDENTDQFEHNFIYSVEFDDFSDEIMEKYQLLDKNINKRLNDRINLISELNGKIISIIKKLGLRYEGQIDGVTFDEANNNNNMTEEQEETAPEFEGIILPDTSNLTIENLNEIKSQLERLEILKFQKLDEIIEKTGQEINHLNNIGYISELEKCRFFQTLKNCRSKEEKLERLEERVATLNTHIQDNEELFNLANKWQTSFEEFKTLEELQKDTTRLFKNRGGSLLAETKKRKKLESILRKTEGKLIKLSEDLGENCTRLRGLSVVDFIEEETSLYEQEKEMEKQGRKLEKKKAIFQESMFGASVITSQVKRGRHQNNAASTKKSKPADISKSCSISSKGSSVISGSSSTFRKPLNNRTPQTAQRKANLKSTQNAPKSAQPLSGFKKPT